MLETKIIQTALKEQEKILRKLQYADYVEAKYLLENMLYSAERLTVHLRRLLSVLPEQIVNSHTTTSGATVYEISIQPISQDGKTVIQIDLPFLLPNRRTATTAFKRTIVQDLRSALDKYCYMHYVEQFEKASVTFINYYAPSAERKIRHDNDNTEISVVLNTLTGLLIPDDSSLCCDLHIISRLAKKSFTRILVKKTDR